MGKVTRCPAIGAFAVLFLLPAFSTATTYRVGPAEKYAKVSEVAGQLKAGDVVEVTGDIMDSAVISARGTSDEPITIVGITRVEDGRIIRPCIGPESESVPFCLKVAGEWVVVEGLAFTGFKRREYGEAALVISGGNITLRNCHFHHNIRALVTEHTAYGNLLVEFCEFASDGAGQLAPYSLMSLVPNATLNVQHCYLHSNTGNNLLRVGYARNVIRYNWFEDQRHFALHITTPELFPDGNEVKAAAAVLPTHSDVVGNVFASGWGSNTYGVIQVGGGGPENPGTEGILNAAHNLFIGRRGGYVPFIPVVAQGNVDRIRLYNNVMVDCRYGGLTVYEREYSWDTGRTRAFASRRGTSEPIVEGSNNWISDSATGVPTSISNNIRGLKPGLFSFVDLDFRPLQTSPLAGKGLCPLPEGEIVSLLPEYEPQRYIPTDLKPRQRRRTAVPSIGPFETAEESPPFVDDSEELVLGVKEIGTAVQWQLPFGKARRRTLECLSRGETDKALQYAKMQFILSPPDQRSIELAVDAVCRVLTTLDGNDKRAVSFRQYALYGPNGMDGQPGTPDDATDPLAAVGLDVFRRNPQYYLNSDRLLQERKAVEPEGAHASYWWVMRWYEGEKAFVRIEGAQFNEALDFALSLLIEVVEQEQFGEIGGDETRRANLIDRTSEILTAVIRARTGSAARVPDTVNQYIYAVRNGVSGPDGLLGTDDDIGVGFGVERFHTAAIPVNGVGADLLNAKETDLSAADRVTLCVAAVCNLKERVLSKIDYVLASGYPDDRLRCPLLIPTATELMEGIRTRMASVKLNLTELSEEEADSARAVIRRAIRKADEEVLSRYNNAISAHGRAADLPQLRAYTTAYLVGVHSEFGYQDLFSLLRDTTFHGQRLPSLVESVITELNDPFTAADLLVSLSDPSAQGFTPSVLSTLLRRIETKQYEAINSICARTNTLSQDKCAPLFLRALGYCERYLNTFPNGLYSSYMHYPMGTLKYHLKDYAASAEHATDFVAADPESPLVPQMLFLKAVSFARLKQTDKALDAMREIAHKYPSSSMAAEALYVLGSEYTRRGDYNAARVFLQRCVDFHPGNKHAQEAKDILGRLPGGSGDGTR